VIILDTTVLVYAVGADHPLRAPSRAIVEAVGDRRLRATTTPEVVQELLHVRARRSPREHAAALARDFGILLSPLVSAGDDDLAEGLDIFAAASQLGAFNSLLAGVARRRGAVLVSADQAFAEVPDLDVVDLAAPDLVDRLTARA
jgi:predicted nucleic acid-binding protein